MDGASDVQREARRPKWPWAAAAVVVVATSVVLLFFLLQQARREADFISCRNHATFVGMALDAHVTKHGRLPHEPGLSGEDLFCRIDLGVALFGHRYPAALALCGGESGTHRHEPKRRRAAWFMWNCQKGSQSPLRRTARIFSTASVPGTVQRMPEPSMRSLTKWRQAPSTAPEPIGYPAARYAS